MRSSVVLLLTLLCTTPAWASALVRVSHLSPDAPNVDVFVDGQRVLEDVPYLATSDYLPLPAGTYQIQVTPAGLTEPVVIDAPVTVDNNTSYTIAATGLLADIAPLVLVDDTEGLPDEAKIRFVHASPDAPAVDVALANGGAVVFPGAVFGDVTDYTVLPAGDYDLEVRLAGTATVVLSLGVVTLEALTNYNVFAVGLVGDSSLGANVLLSAEPGPARVRAAHLSPDAPAVDISVDGTVVLGNVPFGTVSGYLSLDAGTYQIQVTPAGETTPVVIDESVTVSAGLAYTLSATGLLGTADLQLTPSIDDRNSLAAQSKVRFIHFGPDAPAVDVAVTGGPILFENFSFRDIGSYLPVDPGTYDLEVRLAGTSDVALPLPGIEISAGTNVTVFARGLLADASLTAQIAVDVNDRFSRGDVNRDANLDITDAVSTLLYLFVEEGTPFCRDAADFDDNGHLDIGDAVGLLEYLYLGGTAPSAPFPAIGTDSTADALTCDQ